MEVSGQRHVPAAALRPGQHQYPLQRRLSGPQSQSERFGKKKDLLSLLGIQLPVRLACSLVTIPNELSWFTQLDPSVTTSE
jgi:hypothetical protein